MQVCVEQDKAEIVTGVSKKFQGSNTQTPVLPLASRANTSLKKTPKTIHRTIQAGRDLKRSPAQPLVQSRASYRTRLGSLGPYPFSSWKLLRMEAAQSFWASCSTAWLPLWWNNWYSFLYPAGPIFFCFNLACCFSSSYCALLWRAWLCLLGNIPAVEAAAMKTSKLSLLQAE